VSISSRIEYVRDEDLLDDAERRERRPATGVGRRRQATGAALAIVGLPLLTLLLKKLAGGLSIEGQVLLYLLVVVVIALVGGLAIALASAVAAAALINYYFVEPKHTLTVAHADQAVALAVFVAVAGVVSGAVELATRRARAAEGARAEAETLSALAARDGDGDSDDTVRAVLARARETFNMESVTLKRRERGTGDWLDVESVGWAPPGSEAPVQFDLAVRPDMRLVGRGPALFAEDQRVLGAFAGAALSAYEERQLSEREREARELSTVDRQRTALLAAVGHDLRTPLAGIKASVSTLRQSDVAWSDDEREELLGNIEESADRLDAVVRNLLDASRLQAGVLSAKTEPVPLDEVISASLVAVPDAAEKVAIDLPHDLPLVQADPGLLERALANVIDNAVRHGSSHAAVEIRAFAGADSVKMAIVDHGPGVSTEERERLFQPFQRLDDRSSKGVGLGLTVARGFVEAMDGWMGADTTEGGGLTMRLRLPLAQEREPTAERSPAST
jgi:two-component system sensor histidine kinase KdpD